MPRTKKQEIAGKRVCLLTGASGALGTAFAEVYRNYYHIAAVYHRYEPPLPTQHQRFIDPFAPTKELPENLAPLFAVRANLASIAEIDRMVETVLERFGRIDVLINAAVQYDFGQLTNDKLLSTLQSQFEVNFLAPVRIAACITRRFWGNKPHENLRLNRSIINVSSVSALYQRPGAGHAGYSAAKAALNVVTIHLAFELSSIGVRANVCAPASFPHRVTTRCVVDALRVLDQGTMTGEVLVVDRVGSYLFHYPMQPDQ